jgi:hypothetical protein
MRTLLATALVFAATALVAAEPNEAKLAPRVPLHLTALFARASEVTVDATGMAITQFDAPEVLVAHIGADGRPVIGCVDNEKSARLFFATADKPANGSKAQEK